MCVRIPTVLFFVHLLNHRRYLCVFFNKINENNGVLVVDAFMNLIYTRYDMTQVSKNRKILFEKINIFFFSDIYKQLIFHEKSNIRSD